MQLIAPQLAEVYSKIIGNYIKLFRITSVKSISVYQHVSLRAAELHIAICPVSYFAGRDDYIIRIDKA